MTNSHEKIDKYRKLLGISETTDLEELKNRYAELHERFQQQRRATEKAVARKGEKNLLLLDQAYTLLAADIRQRESFQQSEQSQQTMIVEHASFRVGFQVLEGGSKFFRLETSRVSGFGSTRTNNILSSSWPSGKLSLFDDCLEVKCLLGKFQLRYRDIAAIDKAWYIPFWLRVRQHDKDAEAVHIFGWGLGRRLKEVVQQNRLQLNLDY